MANTKISGLTSITGANVDTTADVFPIVDTSVTTTKKITVDELKTALNITPGGAMQLRLSLATGVPVTSQDQTAKTTIFLTPYKGGNIDLYDGIGVWTTINTAEVSVAVPATTGTPFDIWARNVAGVVTLDTTDWTNDTTRATAIVYQTGVLVKSGDTTRRYLGTSRTTTVSGQTEDSYAMRYLWNYYNRARRPMRAIDATVAWSYADTTLRQANANAANKLDFVIGVEEEAVIARTNVIVRTNQAAGTITFVTGIGLDSTTTFATGLITVGIVNANSNTNQALSSFLSVFPAAGRHFLAWLESSTTINTTTWTGSAGVAISGITGELFG